MATEECAICGESVPFATTTHVLVNPKHVEGVADHYVCRPCYDEHLEGLFAALEADVAEEADDGADDLEVTVVDEQEGRPEAASTPGEDGEATGSRGADDALDRHRPE